MKITVLARHVRADGSACAHNPARSNFVLGRELSLGPCGGQINYVKVDFGDVVTRAYVCDQHLEAVPDDESGATQETGDSPRAD